MIIKIGNLFSSRAKTLVNTVNCVGVMGKGIALEFKKRYPDMYDEYVYKCENGVVIPGEPYYYTDLVGNSIINFPTKNHWRSPSKLSYIIKGLQWFRENYKELGITSVAFPPLGCGNGGLSWSVVGPIMYEMLCDLPISIELYAPYGTNSDQLTEGFLKSKIAEINKCEDVIGEESKKINKYWMLILYTIKQLNNDKYALSVGRVIFQKVCYILTKSGIPTQFNFEKGTYGPYSTEVNDAVKILSNTNLMTEEVRGSMIETIVSDNFVLKYNDYTEDELFKVDRAIDLLSRIKNTHQAELITTVLFSYEILAKEKIIPTEEDIFNYVIKWKPHWKIIDKDRIISIIKELAALKWIEPNLTTGYFSFDDDDIF